MKPLEGIVMQLHGSILAAAARRGEP
jgi:hypothetical protein